MTSTPTKDADKLICLIYKDYLEKRKLGILKAKAKNLVSVEKIHQDLVPNEQFEDVAETCRELSRLNLINCMLADNIIYHVELSDSGIAYMEGRFKNGLGEVIDYLSKVFGLIVPLVSIKSP